MFSRGIKPRSIYALHDFDINKKNKGFIRINESEITKYNEQGYGIFWCVNEFEGEVKQCKYATKLHYWFCDIDMTRKAGEEKIVVYKDKESILDKIVGCRLKPTSIVETKNGFHCYWQAVDATHENWERVEKGLINYFNADGAVSTKLNLLRCVYSCHCKNPKEYYLVHYLFDDYNYEKYKRSKSNPNGIEEFNERVYLEKDMLAYFYVEEKKEKVYDNPINKTEILQEENWEKYFKISNWVSGIGLNKSGRNNNFARIIMWMEDEGCSKSEIEYVVSTINNRYLSEGLPEREINALIKNHCN